MPVIKSPGTDTLSTAQPSLEGIDRRARDIIDRARADAARILACGLEEANAMAATIRDESKRVGFTTGHAEGLKQGHIEGSDEARQQHAEDLDRLQRDWQDMLEAWIAGEAQRLSVASKQALELALALAEHVVHRTVSLDPSVVEDQVRQAMALAQTPSDLEVVIAASDRERVYRVMPSILERFESCGLVTITSCDDMASGGCRLQMRGGEVDATLETQLSRLAEAILLSGPVAVGSVDGPADTATGHRPGEAA
jgi:flagellar assembly protein FliH